MATWQKMKTSIPCALEGLSTLRRLMDWSQGLTCSWRIGRFYAYKFRYGWMIYSIKDHWNPSNNSHLHFTLALQYLATPPPVYCPLCVDHPNSLFAFHTPHNCPTIPTMSCSSSPIFIPSHSSSPTNSVNSTPYVVTSPSPDSPTNDELTLPHEQMIVHIAHLLNIEEEEIRCQFPTVCSLLPIDRAPPTPTSILTPDTLMLAYASTLLNDINNYKGIISPPTLSYPGTELEHYVDPNYPNSPPIPSPKPLPVPPPHFHDSMSIMPPTTSATNSTYTLPVIPAFIEDVPSHSPSPISPMAMVLYQQAETNALEAKAMDTDAKKRTPSPTGPQPGVLPGPGWKDNFDTISTCHFFVIPDREEDIIAPFISYDLHATFPELLATNGRGCMVHSHPLYACPVGHHCHFSQRRTPPHKWKAVYGPCRLGFTQRRRLHAYRRSPVFPRPPLQSHSDCLPHRNPQGVLTNWKACYVSKLRTTCCCQCHCPCMLSHRSWHAPSPLLQGQKRTQGSSHNPWLCHTCLGQGQWQDVRLVW